VSALRQGLDILEQFRAEDTHGLSFTDILKRLGAPRSSTLRALGALQEAGYLRRDDAKRYFLGSRVMALGFTYLASQDLIALARPELMRLRDATGCSTYLSILEGDEIVYLAHFAAQRPVLGVVTVGTRSPAHATAMGRIMLACQPPAYVERYYAGKTLRRFAPTTPASLAELVSALAADRARGYAISNASYSPGVLTIAAPLPRPGGVVTAAISAAKLDLEHTVEQYDKRVACDVREAAYAISRLLA
jgi:DNA-binding IclR family transcriptional regulator